MEIAQRGLDDCRRHFELGDTSMIVLAVQWCTIGQLPLPEWLAPDVVAATEHFFRKGGAAGRGKGGGNMVRYRRQRMHRFRHQVALRELARRDSVGGDRHAAFERASKVLAGTFARGSADAVEESHDFIQRLLKSVTQPDRPA